MIQKKIVDLIEQYDTIIIHHHIRPDADCIGSQLGLKYMIESAYPKKRVFAAGNHADSTQFLGPLDSVLDTDYLDALVILVDVGDKHRVDDERFLNGKTIVKIDHHPLTEPLGALEWVDPHYAACAEMIIDLWVHNKERLQMTEAAARVLYAGLLTDTGRFYYNSVTDRTLYYGSLVYQFPFDKEALYSHLYYRSMDELKFVGHVMTHFSHTSNGLAYMKIDQDLLDQFSIDADFASNRVNTLSNIKGIIMWLFFTEDKDTGKIRTSFRSSGPVVNELARRYGGGGHNRASGAVVDNWQVVDVIIQDADAMCGDYQKDYAQ